MTRTILTILKDQMMAQCVEIANDPDGPGAPDDDACV